MGCVVLAFGLQASALAFGPIALVEPLITLELVIALPLASHLAHRPLGRQEWAGGIAVAAGVVIFLLSATPHGGQAEPSLAGWAIVAAPVIIAAACLAAFAGRPETKRRTTMLAVSAGLFFGVQALITQSFVVLLGEGPAAAFTSWQPYVLICLGLTGFTVAQSAYQSGPLAISLPIVDSLEPIGAVILAGVLFSQRVSLDNGALWLECLGAVVALTGIVLLGRSPLVLSIYEQERRIARSAPTPFPEAVEVRGVA
jgi:drug/metabolite transporter (DMT)-like permease